MQVRDTVRMQTRECVRVHAALSLIAFGVFLLIPFKQIQADPITVSPIPASTEVQLNGPNDPLVIEIHITNPDPQSIKSWSIDLYFDPAVFDPRLGIGTVPEQGFEMGNYIPGVLGVWNPNYEANGVSPDIARLGALNLGTGTGSATTGLLARIALDVLSLSPGSTIWLQGQLILSGGGAAPGVIFESIQIVVVESPPPTITTAESLKTHGSAGEFGINVLEAGPAGLECRRGGTSKIIVTFDRNIQRINGDLTDIALSSGTALTVDTLASILTITMANTTDAEPLLITFPGIADSHDITKVVAETLCIRQLAGNVMGNGAVNLTDLAAIRDDMDETSNATNFRSDINANGVINLFDMLDVRDRMDNTLSGSCP